MDALDELRRHPLDEPRAYVLMLVEAAVLSRAEEVRIQCIDWAVRVELGPLLFRREELEQLFASPLGPIAEYEGQGYRRAPDDDVLRSLRVKVLQKLALACCAALSLEPTGMRIDSIDRSGKGLRWRSAPARPQGEVLDVEGEQPGTRIEIAGVVGERDRELLRQRCRASLLPIYLNDERISRGPAIAMLGDFARARERGHWSPRVRLRRIVDEQGRTLGYAGRSFDPQARTARVIVLCNGVEIETIELPLGRPFFLGVVELDLPRDIAQTRLRQGPELAAVLAAAQRRTRGIPRAQVLDVPAQSRIDDVLQIAISLLLLAFAIVLLANM